VAQSLERTELKPVATERSFSRTSSRRSNGTQVAEFNGKAPDGGGLVGVETYSPKTGGETEARFTNFVVAEPK
jgi:hypothetical protein